MANIDKIKALKITLVVLWVIGCSIFIFQVMAVDVLGHRAKAGVSAMQNVSDILCEERIRTGEYPDKDDIVEANLKRFHHIKSFTYSKQNKDAFELQVTLSNILRADTFYRVNSEGVFLRDGERGEWRKWFINQCKEKIDDYKKSSDYFDKLKNQPAGPQRRAKSGA